MQHDVGELVLHGRIALRLRLLLCDHRPVDHRPDVAAGVVGDGRDMQLEGLRAHPDVRLMRQIFRVRQEHPDPARFLVEDVDALAEHLRRAHWQVALEQLHEVDGRLVHVGQIQVGVRHHDVHVRVVDHVPDALRFGFQSGAGPDQAHQPQDADGAEADQTE